MRFHKTTTCEASFASFDFFNSAQSHLLPRTFFASSYVPNLHYGLYFFISSLTFLFVSFVQQRIPKLLLAFPSMTKGNRCFGFPPIVLTMNATRLLSDRLWDSRHQFYSPQHHQSMSAYNRTYSHFYCTLHNFFYSAESGTWSYTFAYLSCAKIFHMTTISFHVNVSTTSGTASYG